MNRAILVFALLGAIGLAGCGNRDTTRQTTFDEGPNTGNQPFKPVTHLYHRALVSNYESGTLEVMDASENKLTTYTFAVGSQPTYMQPTPDGTLTLVNNSGSNSLSSLNNSLEAIKATINLGGWTESFVTSVDDKSGFAAVYNYSNGTYRTSGGIVRFNPTDGSVNTAIPFPNVRYLAMDPAEKHLLAFTDVEDGAHWVDLTTIDPATQVPTVSLLSLKNSSGVAVALSRPVAAFFSADSTKAYILSCGTECGGASAASVTEIDVSNNAGAPTVLNQWPVNGARIGLIDTTANKLYVAGSTTTLTDGGGYSVPDGYFTVIDLTAGTASAPIRIGNGVKRWIRNINGVFWVASLDCGVQSCVTMVKPSAGTASVLAAANGDATGIALMPHSGEVYTVEGGELYIYDQKGNPITSEYKTDIVGQGYDVLYID